MIDVAEASRRILERLKPLSGEAVATGNAAGRVASAPVVAPFDSPPWDNSSMDGYAARSSDLATGAVLSVVERVSAGSFPTRPVGPGEAIRVMTGAPVPQGADSVVRHEDTDNGMDRVTIHDVRDSGRNIRKAGEDFRTGDVLIQPGDQLGIAHLGVLASAGAASVQVHRRPRVAILSSGDELVRLEEFDIELYGEKIVSANSVTLAAAVSLAGGEPYDLGIAADDPESMRAKLRAAMDSDLIVSSAGISVGDHDHVREAFESLGGALEFWKVRMRPGAPVAFGSLNGVPWIGLSGNPVSAIVTFELFVRPAIRRLCGARDLFRATIPVRIAEPLTLAASLMHFLRVVITPTDDGIAEARLAGSQSSAVLTALARADALLILPGDRLEIAEGETLRALPLGDALRMSEKLRLT